MPLIRGSNCSWAYREDSSMIATRSGLTFLVIIVATLAITGCDAVHEAVVKVHTSVHDTALDVRGHPSHDAVVVAFKGFAHEIQYPCYSPRGFAIHVMGWSKEDLKDGVPAEDALLVCGPAWFRTLTLYKKSYGYKVLFSQGNPGWGVPPYFCKTQEKLFAYFSARFPKTSIELLDRRDWCKDFKT